MTTKQATHTPGPKLPPGYRLSETDSGILGAMWTAHAPDGTDLGSCGGGSGRNAGAANRRRAAELCWTDFGHRAEPLLAALRAIAAWDPAAAPGEPNGMSIMDAQDMARAAIAKATGGAS